MRKVALSLVGALALFGCASPGPAKFKVAAVDDGSYATPADGAYQSASAAIYRRQYAQALDLLQIAREKAPSDARVLNAFGVVYDKLGRFDLAQRYYAQAAQLDPGSLVVASNVAYSHALQRHLADEQAPRSMAVALSQPKFEPPITRATLPVLTMAAPSRPVPASVAKPPKAASSAALMVLNAGGSNGSADTVRARLIELGWSAKEPVTNVRSRKDSSVTYPVERKGQVLGLTRTLGAPVRMIECVGCQSIKLSVGEDAVNWRLGRWLKIAGTRTGGRG